MRKGSLLSAFSRKHRSTKEETSVVTWDQNAQAPVTFYSAFDQQFPQQEQQQPARGAHPLPSGRMPKLPGAPSQQRCVMDDRPQFSDRPGSRSSPGQAAPRPQLPSLHQNGIQPRNKRPTQQQQQQQQQLGQWPHLNSVPEPMPGIWSQLGPADGSQDSQASQSHNQSLDRSPAVNFESTGNHLMESYAQPDAYTGGTYAADADTTWPSFQMRHAGNHSGTPENRSYPTALLTEESPDAGETLDPWTGLLQHDQAPQQGLQRGPGSGINWGLDRDSVSLAASASQNAASSHRASQRTSAGPLRGPSSPKPSWATPGQPSRTSTPQSATRTMSRTMSHTMSHSRPAGRGRDSPDGLPMEWAHPAQGRTAVNDRSADRGSETGAGSTVGWGDSMVGLGLGQREQTGSSGNVEAQRVQDGLSWAQQHAPPASRIPRIPPRAAQGAQPRDAMGEQRLGTASRAAFRGGRTGHGAHQRSHQRKPSQQLYREQEAIGNCQQNVGIRDLDAAMGDACGGLDALDASMAGASLFIAANASAGQAGMSLQWNLPQPIPRQLPKPIRAASTAADAASVPSPINR